MYWFDKLDIVLASGSPRRKSLLEEAGFRFTVMISEIDESYPEDMAPENVAAYLAKQKASVFVKETLPSNRVIITADSVVINDGKILGKPVSIDDSRQMLQGISGKKHDVITGVCLLTQNRLVAFSAKTVVQLATMTDEEIEFYIRQYRPFDKAGSYGIQEWLGICKIGSIEGSYTNVMGLPMEQVYHELMKMI